MSSKHKLPPEPSISAAINTRPSSDHPSSIDTTSAHTPLSTPSDTPQATPANPADPHYLASILSGPNMDTAREQQQVEEVQLPKQAEEASQGQAVVSPAKEASTSAKEKKAAKLKCKKKHKHKHKKSGKKSSKKADKDSDDSSSDDSSDSDSEASSDSDSDSSSEEEAKKKKKHKSRSKRKAALKKKSKKSKKSKRDDSSSDDDSSDSSSDSESEDEHAKRKRRKRRARKAREEESSSDEEEEDSSPAEEDSGLDVDGSPVAADPLAGLNSLRLGRPYKAPGVTHDQSALTTMLEDLLAASKRKNKKEKISKKSKKGKGKEKVKRPKKSGKPEYKRVDQLWDSNIHDYKLTETAEEQADEFDEYVFNVRRKFDWENKYRNTVVDIKSKQLREALGEIMKDVKAISLVEHQPSIDPNMLFLYLDELRTFYRKTLKERFKKEKKKKLRKKIKVTRAHCKLLVSYLDTDYDETKKTLFPMLKAGNITFELLWALFKPNTQAYTTTYGSSDHPRCFKVDYANKEKSFMRGEYYCIEGRYLEYDGKNFGLGDYEVHIDSFKGPRKITSLPVFPLQYHKDPESVKKTLIERGKKFVVLSGMNYKFMKGLAFHKKKKNLIVKVNINGRIMIDPAIFRRINPNYMISNVKPKEDDMMSDEEQSCCGSSDESDDERDGGLSADDEENKGSKTKFKVVLDDKNEAHLVEVNADDADDEASAEKLDKLPSGDSETPGDATKSREFTEEELLIASPVVLGFSFTEKAWLEFSISGVHDIDWDDGAFESLVLPPNHKSIVKAQVCSHKFHAAQTIDDVIQGKGKGLVFVLHGPPGVGKTLTAEGIAEFLRCPLYAVSAGELGTDARIEHELQKIMDIAHSWGAVLLLDEADVFLEKRQHQDVHRNALVSIFLRLLEYFQGILFLTTNRVETFDDAFQSRIHIALRYEELSLKAKTEIWKLFVGRVEDSGHSKIAEFREKDYEMLARNDLNGRQIKNAVKCAQALAVDEKIPLCIEHIRRVLEVMQSFDRHLKGGSGYMDAMRSYT